MAERRGCARAVRIDGDTRPVALVVGRREARQHAVDAALNEAFALDVVEGRRRGHRSRRERDNRAGGDQSRLFHPFLPVYNYPLRRALAAPLPKSVPRNITKALQPPQAGVIPLPTA